MENSNKVLFFIVGALVVFGIGLALWSSRPTQTMQPPSTMQPTPQQEITKTMTEPIAVTGGSFYFEPNEIRVKKGEKVVITFTNKEGTHNFVIDEFGVKTEIISAGASTEITFTPDKTGTFEFYCSVGNHRAMGMKGTLIVE